MIVAKPGVKGMAGLKGKRIGVELGMLSHLLLSKALETAPLSETDVTLVNVATEEAPQALKSGAVDAIAAWQPFGGQALHELPGASVVFSSKNTPGLIFDLLCVNPRSLAERRADWTKVVEVWFKIAAFINDPANVDEAAQIMGARIGLAADDYKWLMQGTFFLGLEGNLKAWKQSEGTGSVYGSSKVVDSFYTRNNMYKAPVKYSEYFDGSIVQAISGSQ
jgi:NitT/TauT family transport system substrate-binding protein